MEPKQTRRMSWVELVCMVAGIVAGSIFLDFGDSRLAAGIECGFGCLAGLCVYRVFRTLNKDKEIE